MKRIQKFLAINIVGALIGTGIPAMAAQGGHDGYNRGGMQYESADHRGYRERDESRMHDFRNDDRRDGDRGSHDRGDQGRGYRADRGAGYGYAPAYQSAHVYRGPVYNDGYYDQSSHNGRTAAIIAGTAAAGALIGAAAGHGQGAVIGAVIGGVAGAAVSSAADHRHR
jgi:Glycine zipper